MKQLIQDLKNGHTILEEVPVPQKKAGAVLIKTTHSLVSLGTERMLVEFGKAGLIEKFHQQPDRVKQVLDKMKTDGIIPTLETVFNKLMQGGTVTMPLQDTFWNAKFGMVLDKFGINWMLNCDKPKATN